MEQDNEKQQPIVLLYIYSKIRRKTKGNIISFKKLKEIITRTIITNNKELKGVTIGLPRVGSPISCFGRDSSETCRHLLTF